MGVVAVAHLSTRLCPETFLKVIDKAIPYPSAVRVAPTNGLQAACTITGLHHLQSLTFVKDLRT